MNPEIDGVARVENAHFRSFGGRFAFVRFLLAKIGDDFGRLPERVVQGSVKLRSVIDTDGFGALSRGLVLCAVCGCFSSATSGKMNEKKQHTESAPPQGRRVRRELVHYAT